MFEIIALQDDPDSTLLLAPHFLAAPEAEKILAQLLQETPWQQRCISVYGKEHLEPRLTAWYGDPGASYAYSGMVHEPLPWTDLLLDLRKRIMAATNQRFNSVLLNQYRDGSDSVGWHSDNEPELGSHPCIASLSLGETRRFLLRRKKMRGSATGGVDLASGSLLVMQGALQERWQHSVAKTTKAQGPRINLTFRLVY